MAESTTHEGSAWKTFVRKHSAALALFMLACIVAAAGGVYVFWWFTGYAQSSNLVPSSLRLWTMGDLIAFILNSIFWELLLVGIPAVIAAIVAYMWWRKLPEEERRGYHLGRGSKRTRGGGGVSIFFFIAFCIKVYLDGNWNVPIANFTLNYLVGSMITILVWTVVIFGIPIAIGLTWWIRRMMRTP